jgi:hypothetical protein
MTEAVRTYIQVWSISLPDVDASSIVNGSSPKVQTYVQKPKATQRSRDAAKNFSTEMKIIMYTQLQLYPITIIMHNPDCSQY